MPNYSNGKIYHIVCNLTGEIYYGSTVQRISMRMGTHRKNKDCCSKQIIERGDYHYGLVEDYKCENKEQLLMRERYYVDNNNCINKKSPFLSKEEKIAIMNERTYKQYNKPIGYYCKLCDKNIKDRSNWSKHIKTYKHLRKTTTP